MAEHPWDEVKEKFNAALSLSVKERELYLQQLSAESTELHHNVAEMLAHHRDAEDDGFLESLQIGKKTEAELAETIQLNLPTIDLKESQANGDSMCTLSQMAEIEETSYIGELGDYQLIEQIGRGGMGVVYKAHQKKIGRTVALKVIAAGSLCAPEDIARFHDEASAAGRLNHPGIVPVYDAGEHNGTHYFSMAYIEGETLASYVGVDKPRLEPRRAAKLMEEVCRAVQYAHDRAVIHRDIKPANIMLDKSGQPLLTDFGLAKLIGNEGYTQTGQVMGTPNYMAPEQAKGQQDLISTRTDVYSLGATLYALLSGAPAFIGKNLIDTLRKVESAAPEPLTFKGSPVPLDLWIICEKCLSKRPEDRYESASALADDLQRFLHGFPITARAVGPWTRFQRWCQRNPLIATLIGTVAATLLLATIVSISLAVVARANQTRAEENLAMIEKVLEEALVSVSEDDLSNDPGTQKVRERLLRIAQDYYADLSATQQVSALKLARAGFLLGRVQSSLGLENEARDSFHKALQIQMDRIDEADEPVAALVAIANSHKELAKLDRLWNDPEIKKPTPVALAALDISIKHDEECVAWRARALGQSPQDSELRRLLGNAKMGLGSAVAQKGLWQRRDEDLNAADNELAEALDIYSKLQSKHPDNYLYAKDLAIGYTAQAVLRESQAALVYDTDESKYTALLNDSLELRFKAVGILEKLPSGELDSETRYKLANCYQKCAENYFLLQKDEECIKSSLQALEVYKFLLMSNPLVYKYRERVADVQFNLSQFYFMQQSDLGYEYIYLFQQTLADGIAINPHNQEAIDLLLARTTTVVTGLIEQDLFQEALNQIEQAKSLLTNMQILESDKPLVDAVIEKLDAEAAKYREEDRTT